MTDRQLRTKMRKLILSKLDGNRECELIRKSDGQLFFIKQYNNRRDSWFLYQDSDLVIGDTTLNYLIEVLVCL